MGYAELLCAINLYFYNYLFININIFLFLKITKSTSNNLSNNLHEGLFYLFNNKLNLI